MGSRALLQPCAAHALAACRHDMGSQGYQEPWPCVQADPHRGQQWPHGSVRGVQSTPQPEAWHLAGFLPLCKLSISSRGPLKDSCRLVVSAGWQEKYVLGLFYGIMNLCISSPMTAPDFVPDYDGSHARAHQYDECVEEAIKFVTNCFIPYAHMQI